MADKKIKLPGKSTMNLYQPAALGSRTALDSRKILIYIIVGVLLAALLGFGVIGRYVHYFNQKSQLEESKAELDVFNAQLTDYDNVKAEYDRYSRGFMTEDEKNLEKRGDIIRTVNSACAAFADVKSISVVDNEASVEIVVSKLDDVAKVRKSLENNPDVKEVRVYTADKAAKEASGKITASLVFNYGAVIKSEEGAE